MYSHGLLLQGAGGLRWWDTIPVFLRFPAEDQHAGVQVFLHRFRKSISEYCRDPRRHSWQMHPHQGLHLHQERDIGSETPFLYGLQR